MKRRRKCKLHTFKWTPVWDWLCCSWSACCLGRLRWSTPAGAAAQATGNQVGIVCTTGTQPEPDLQPRRQATGYIILGDGNTMYMWGYRCSGQPFQHPGPVLCVNEGDTVTVILHNTLPDDVSIMFPGQDNVLANGAPAQPQFDAAATLTSLTNVAAANGGSVTYSFVASKPGTYIYESGTDPEKQVRMGLFGALIVRPWRMGDRTITPTTGPTASSRPTRSSWCCCRRSTRTSTRLPSRAKPFDLNTYHPHYWLINGRTLPRQHRRQLRRPGCPSSRTARWRASTRTIRPTTRIRAWRAISTWVSRTTPSTPRQQRRRDRRGTAGQQYVTEPSRCGRKKTPLRIA